VTTSGSFILSFDVGGSHVSACRCELDTLRVVQVANAPLGEVASFEGFVDTLYLLGREVRAGLGSVAGAALAVPGPFDCARGVSLMQHKLQALYGRDLRGAVAARFGLAPDRIRFLNDAAAFLLGEVSVGSARGASRAAGLTLGTGIGSAFAQDGHALLQGDGVPPGGEVWNLPYKDGTVEDLISTRALKKDYAALTGRDLEVKEIAAAAPADSCARQVFATFGEHLGDVIRDVVAPFHPELVVIGGGISRSSALFLPMAQKRAGAGLRLVPSTLLYEAHLVGAAYFWREECAPANGPAAIGAAAGR